MIRNAGWVLLVLLFEFEFGSSKRVMGELQLSSQTTEQYIAKFSLSKGSHGHLEAQFFVDSTHPYFDSNPHTVKLSLFDDQTWDEFQRKAKSGSLCNDRVQLAQYHHKIEPQFEPTSDPVKVIKFEQPFEPKDSTHYWFLVVSDCFLEEYDAHPPPMAFNLIFKNGDSHLPADEVGLPTLFAFMSFVLLCVSLFFAYSLHRATDGYKGVHLVVLLLGLGIQSQLASLLFETIHLWVYERNGLGMRWRHSWLPLDFLAEACQGLSELVVAFVLIAISFGWTLSIPNKLANSSFKHFYHISGNSFLLFLGLLSIQVVLEFWGRKYQDDFSQFHDFEHLPGYLLIMFRFGQWVLFLYGLLSTKKRSTEESVTGFLVQLATFGTLWFLTFPAVVIISTTFPPYLRHSIVTGTAVVMQCVALMLLGKLFLSKGQYYRASTLSQVGTVFGGQQGFVGGKISTE